VYSNPVGPAALASLSSAKSKDQSRGHSNSGFALRASTQPPVSSVGLVLQLPSVRWHPTSVPYKPWPKYVRIVVVTRASPSLPGRTAHVQFR